MPEPAVAAAVARLDELTRRLRRECPWDREQDERSIVPHTVEEAYELADAAQRRRRRQAARRAGRRAVPGPLPLAAARGARRRRHGRRWPSTCRQKLIRRHPHVFGEVEAETAGEVLRNWDAIKRAEPGREEGIFGDVPENLPGAAVRAQAPAPRRVAGLRLRPHPLRRRQRRARGARGRRAPTATRFDEVGDLLFAAVNVARKLRVDPELALRAASARFRGRIEAAEGLAAAPARLGGADPRRQADLLRPSEVERMSQIEQIHARQILDCRGNPTVEVEVALRSGARRARRGAVAAPRPASSRRPSCATAATPTAARASRRRSATSTARSPRRSPARDATDQAGPRPRADRARRHRRTSRGSAPTRSSASRSRPRTPRRPRRASRCGATSAATPRTSCRCR